MDGYVGALEQVALRNTFFRRVLFTSRHTQIVVMCLQPGEDTGDEVHAEADQFFRIERGDARFVFDDKDERLAHAGDGVVVPAGTHHSVFNASKSAPLRLYTIYSPPAHPEGTVHKTRLEAEESEAVQA